MCINNVLQLAFVLDIAHKSNKSGSTVCQPFAKDLAIIDTMIIKWPDVITVTALSVDLSFATNGIVEACLEYHQMNVGNLLLV